MINELINTAEAGLSEESAKLIASNIAAKIADGELYSTQGFAIAKWLKVITESLEKNELIKEVAETELVQNGGRLHQKGIEFALKPIVKYDYTTSEAWNQLKADTLPFEAARKEVEKMAKSISTLAIYVHPGTGEELEVKPATRRQSESISVKLPKTINTDLPWEK